MGVGTLGNTWQTSQAAGTMCSLQLGGSTLKPEHDTAQKSSCFSQTLFAVLFTVRGCEDCQPTAFLGPTTPHSKWWPLRRCYSTFTAGGQLCVSAMAWLCTVREVPKERCMGSAPHLHRPGLQRACKRREPVGSCGEDVPQRLSLPEACF